MSEESGCADISVHVPGPYKVNLKLSLECKYRFGIEMNRSCTECKCVLSVGFKKCWSLAEEAAR